MALREVLVTRVGVPPMDLEPGLGRLPVGVTVGRQVPPPLRDKQTKFYLEQY